jgi:trehalose-phosphatase
VGIAGIALGFGAQNLVRDMISGIFVLLEDQYRVGDVASVGGKTGLVEGVSLRRTVLRDLDGIVHVVPNGEITVSSNFTKSFSRVNLDVGVAYKEDLNHVFRVLNRVGNQLAQDQYFGPLILEPPQVVRVDSFDASGIAVKMLGVTRPIRQWEVTGELRRRIKEEFDREHIEIPFPHQTIYWGVDSHPRAEPGGYPRTAEPDHRPDAVDLELGARDPWVQQTTEDSAGVAVPGPAGTSGRRVPNLLAHQDVVSDLLQAPPLAVFTDIDGTLASIAPNPKVVKLPPAVREALNYLSQRHTVAILTGRDVASARAFLGLTSVTYYGNHGLEIWERGSTTVPPEAQPFKRQIQRLHREARNRLSSQPGITIENKGLALALHYRQAPDAVAARQTLLDFLQDTPEARSLTVYEGKMVVEAHADLPLNKGTALRSVVERHGIRSALVFGDDTTDLDSFRMLRQMREAGTLSGLCVAVTGSDTPSSLLAISDYYLTDAESVEIFLSWLVTELKTAGQQGVLPRP